MELMVLDREFREVRCSLPIDFEIGVVGAETEPVDMVIGPFNLDTAEERGASVGGAEEVGGRSCEFIVS